MHLRSIAAAATIAAAAILGFTTAAHAQQPAYRPAGGYHQIHDLRWVTGRVGTAVLTLQKETREYGGHRAAALEYLRNAHSELRAAEEFAGANGYQYGDLGYYPPNNTSGFRAGVQANDRAVYNAQQHAQTWIATLQRESRDFGGHKENAIGWLQRAETELTLALR